MEQSFEFSKDLVSFIDIWSKQEKFEKKFFTFKGINWDNLNLEQKLYWSKEFYTHIIVELSEMMDKMQYKMHRNYTKEINEFNIKENIIDSFKFLLGLSQLWFCDVNEFVDMFNDKTAVVNKRFEFEKLKNLRSAPKPGIAIIDIDGVLADLETNLFDYIMSAYNCVKFYSLQNYSDIGNLLKNSLDFRKSTSEWNLFKSTRDIKNAFPELYEKIKHLYRQTQSHRYLNVISGAKEFVTKLKDMGFKIVIITARPYENYNNLWADTMFWLETNKIHYDALYFDNKKHETILELFSNKLNKIKFIVDDTKEICDAVNNLGISAFNIDHKNETFETILTKAEKIKKWSFNGIDNISGQLITKK